MLNLPETISYTSNEKAIHFTASVWPLSIFKHYPEDLSQIRIDLSTLPNL